MHGGHKQLRTINCQKDTVLEKEKKTRAVFTSAAEQTLLMKVYEEYKGVITKKGNTAAINKVREMALHKISDRLNAYVIPAYTCGQW